MKPIEVFADYNKDNILGAMLQAETHYKNLDESSDPNFAACINKHLLEAQMELSELQAHEPENLDEYRDMMTELRKLRKDNIRGIQPREAMGRLRSIRGRFEGFVEGHDTEKCRSCGEIHDVLGKIESKTLNRERPQDFNIKIRSYKMARITSEMKEAVPQILGGSFVGKGISVVTPMVLPGSMLGVVRDKTVANLIIGIGLTAAALYGKLDKVNILGAVAGSNLVASEIVDLVMGVVPTAPAAYAPAYAASVAGMAPSNIYATTIGATGGSNGGLVYID